MKFPSPLQIAGALVLLACMVFALARLASADSWVSLWLPCVGVGVAPALIGTLLSAVKKGNSNE